jgi:uncharacterized membrane protein
MTALIFALRLIHIVSGVGWLGEVATVNFVLMPALVEAGDEGRTAILEKAFPLVFRLATVLGGTAIVSGLGVVLWYTQLRPSVLLESPRGWLILCAGAMGGLLYVFHLLQESRGERTLATALAAATAGRDREASTRFLRRLVIFPRIGLIVLVLVVSLMIAAAHYPFS